MNYRKFLNPVSLARQPSPIRILTALLARSGPSMISLAGGMPNPKLFPFEEAEFKLRDGTTLHLNEERMNVALQYGATNGISDFVAFLKKLQKHLHNPPNFDWKPEKGGIEICITPGSQDGLLKSFEMLINPGDNVLVDSPTYASALAALRPLGCNLVSIDTDENGMIPLSLANTLSSAAAAAATADSSDAVDGKGKKEQNMPKILYIIPNGVNPTGASLNLQRKKDIYQIAQQYDLLILEDDPYYFLQFNESRIPSFLSMDEDGRVLRFDSFSKIISSGLRVGYVTGPSPLVERIVLHLMVSAMHTPTMSQVMMSDLLNRWGISGLESHVYSVKEFYKSQKDLMVAAAKKWLTGLAEWNEPTAGMFLWIKLKGIEDTKYLIEEKAQKKEVLLVPGYAFMPDPTKPCPYVRASYSLATPEQMDKAFERLAELIKEEMPKEKK